MLDYRQMQAVAAPIRFGSLTVRMASDPPGVIDSPARSFPAILIHVGQSVQIACRRGGQNHRGLAVHGDIDVIPAGTPSRWELMQKDKALVIGVRSDMLRGVEIVNRFQTRDVQIEHIGWAVRAAMEADQPASRLYTDSLATALAVRLVERHSSIAQVREERVTLSGRKLRLVLSYIEDDLARDLSLDELAAIAGIGVSQFKKAFRESMGLPVHRYVIQRRVERATTLLLENKLTIGQIAIDTGFAHQSHLARHIRRALRVSPRELRESGYRK